MKLTRGTRALVTGAASGIGRALALELARHGVDIFAVDLNADKLAVTVGEIESLGVRAVGHVCDVASHEQIRQTVAKLLESWGGVEILVNNAGITYRGSTHEMTLEQWDAVISINLLAAIRFIDALLPTFRKTRHAHILNVASIFGLIPVRRIAAYQTTKYALVGLSQSLRLEYGSYGLGVTALCPGFVNTGLFEASEQAGMLESRPKLWSWWVTTPEHVARKAVRAIEKNRGICVVPLLAEVFWGLLRIYPQFTEMLIRIKRSGTRRRHGEHVVD